jgi:hypothetical protein
MVMKKERVGLILVETKFRHDMVKITMGHSFYYLRDKRGFCLSTTPYSDPTLVPIYEVSLGEERMEFTISGKSNKRHCVIEYGGFPGSQIVGELIKNTNEGQGFNLGLGSNNDLEFQSDEEGMSILLLDRSNKLVQFFLPNRRIIFLEDNTKMDGEIVNLLEGTVHLLDHTLSFHGKTVEGGNEVQLTWKLDFDESIASSMVGLIKIFIQNFETIKSDT